jgi:hypothetical protein
VNAYARELERPDARLEDRAFVACGLAWAAGLVHAVAALDHGPRPAALLMAAAVQLSWGVALYMRPGRGVLVAGVLLNAAAVGFWIGSPTLLESVAITDELALALLALAQLRPRRAGRIAGALRAAAMAGCVYLILVSSLLLTPGSAQQGVKGSLVGVPRAGLGLICHTQ